MNIGHADGGSQSDRAARANQVDPGSAWDELVLPDEELDSLRSIARHLRERHDSRQAKQGAVDSVAAVLFLGAAGTGKTMAARIIAADADAPVHTLDLAPALPGAESHLERIAARAFRSAVREGAVLVIDGAGPLLRPSAPDWHGMQNPEAKGSGGPVGERLAPRSDTGSERAPIQPEGDDAINVRLSRLLRRIDRYDGLVILTSTVTHGIDPAVADRFGAVVTFPLPGFTARKEIWRRSLPRDAQLTESNLDYLAGWLHWPGGTIHRCCLAAADLAAEEGVPVQLRHVAGGLDQGHRTDGRLVQKSTLPSAPARSPGIPARAPGPSKAAASPLPASVDSGTSTPVPAPVRSGPDPAHGAGPAAPRRFGRRWRVATAAIVVAAVVIGAIVAVISAQTSRPAGSRAAFVAGLRLSVPSNWRQSNPARRPSLGLTQERAIASPAPGAGELVIGKMVQDQASPLPPPLLATVPSTATPQIVKVGRLVFYRYRGSPRAGGSAAESIYAMPTTRGTVIGVCRPQEPSSAFTTSCIRVLATLQLTSGKALPLTLRATYARELNAAISRLNVVRSSAGTHLATATTVPAQAAAATQLAQAHGEAASAVSRLSAGVAATANAALAHALVMIADAYRALARSAAHHDTRAYSAARADLVRSARALDLAFSQLKRLGFQVT